PGISDGDLKTALEGLGTIGLGNVDVSKNGNVYTITFQGTLGNDNQPQIVADGTNLTLTPATAAVVTTVNGSASLHEQQEVIVDATSGTLTLTFNGATTTTKDGTTAGALDYNVSAADLQKALEALPTIGANHVHVTTLAPIQAGVATTYVI